MVTTTATLDLEVLRHLMYDREMDRQTDRKEETVTYVDADLYAELNDPARKPQVIPGLVAAASKSLDLD